MWYFYMQVNIHRAKTHLSELISEVLVGKEVIIAKAGKPLVQLVLYQPSMRQRKGGQLRGLIHIKDDFDAALPEEIEKSFRGEGE